MTVRLTCLQGLTWSNASVVAEPQAPGPSECALVDGAAFHDKDTHTWYYLSQCLDRNQVWSMCLFACEGCETPLSGRFVAKFGAKPNVASGELWSQICAGSGKVKYSAPFFLKVC